MNRRITWGEVARPSVCPECLGEGAVGTVTQSWCSACRCVLCGVPCTTGFCPDCDAADMYEQDLRRERAR